MTVARIPRAGVPIIAALATLVVHLAGNPHFGYSRDELYFIICGFHPAWGYVDQPPVVPLLAAASQLFGHSLFALRAIPALFAAGSVYVACLLAIEFGGGTFAVAVTALATGLCPVLMSFGMKLSTDTPGLVLWPLAALLVVRILKGADPRLWLAAGAVVGLGVESKDSAILFAAALVTGIALTRTRTILRTPWFAAGAALALAIALPNALWQAAYGFPILEVLRNSRETLNLVAGPPLFLAQQALITNPLVAIVWLAGLIWLLRNDTLRFLGVSYVALIVLSIATHGKHYYPADVYPILIAAGAVAIEAGTRAFVAARAAIVAAIAAAGLVSLPFTLPLLGEQAMIDYQTRLGTMLHIGKDAVAMENVAIPPLLPDYAEMHGWPELAGTVAHVYDSLPQEQRERAAIVANNYAEASAIEFFGTPYGLPPALSGNNNFFLWGPRGFTGDVVIDVNGDCWRERRWFSSARVAAYFSAPWTMPAEDEFPISVCTGPRANLAALWPAMREYIAEPRTFGKR